MSAPTQSNMAEIHWMMEMFQNIDVGLVVLDRTYSIHVWNSFMENHSGLSPERVRGETIFRLFPEVQEDWLRRKCDTAFLLNNRAFLIWEQRPYLFRFRNYRPITGTAEYMYQNVTIIPLTSASGEVDNICLIVYDVTDEAVAKQSMQEANSQLEQLSRTDRLTRLNNRGFWEECLEREFQRCQRNGAAATLVMFDIDHFKAVNDTYGHQAGDEVIRKVSDVLRKNLRATDIAGRYGGEEFGVVLVDTDAPAARFFAERLRKQCAALKVEHDGQIIEFTISLGIAQFGSRMVNHQAWIEQSDQALYQAKEGGRNQVVVYGEAAPA
ncbi:GGDEF domain-containing protein [Alkalilimnicola sp. S0819]|uniref:GGDEF domain-containing protein n=1 Tax=Alkalilimnicola sp. S0819 TaxID=2613922 RepID=UPI001262AABE|nr:sensor domain-containing diguanylate cyclase [Alkalilimnicola sp. S0819]KAB7622788.1 GGDEF domain-containing protein [Alkalilimnicola sp. S0819]MPQ17284.1 diguanylate cyclase [Alkalilimnicola sp. S0819]